MDSNKIGNLNFINDDYLFIITQAELLVRDWLQKFSRSSHFFSQMKEIFGEVEVTALQQQWQRREVEFPEIEIVGKNEINEANGAFASANSKIYIAREFLADNVDNIALIVSVVLEELGHYFDKKLHPNLDSKGDEGELFAAIVTEKELTNAEIQRIKQEDDSAIVTIDGQTLEVEQANYNLGLVEGNQSFYDSIFYQDEDYFTFQIGSTGTLDNYISVVSNSTNIDLVLELYDQYGNYIQANDYNNNYNYESLLLTDLIPGTYTARVYDYYGGYYVYPYSADYTLTIDAPQSPSDLTLYQPPGWSSGLIISTVLGTNSDAPLITTRDYLYVDGAWINQGIGTTGQEFTTNLLLDGIVIGSQNSPTLEVNNYDFFTDFVIPPLTAGNHVLRLEIDSYNSITESLENNNIWEKSFTVIAPSIPQDNYEINDNFAQATPVSSGMSDEINNNQIYIFEDLSIHSTMDTDFFKFTLDSYGTEEHLVLALVNSETGDIDFNLYDGYGSPINNTYWTANGEGSNYISLQGLPPGDYYIQAGSFESNLTENYSLGFSLPQSISADSYESNNTFATAKSLSQISGINRIENLTIHNSEDVDYFYFTLDEQATSQHYIEIDFDSFNSDLDLFLFDNHSNLIDFSNGFDDTERISLEGLTVGTYYISVETFSGDPTPYTLTLNAPGNAINEDVFDSNNIGNNKENSVNLQSRETGWQQGTGFKKWDYLSITEGDEDWFQFELKKESKSGHFVAIALDNSRGDLDLELYDSSGKIREAKGTRDLELISLESLAKGTYYVRVLGYDGATNPNYTLGINLPGGDRFEDNDAQDKAKDLKPYRTSYLTSWDNLSVDNDDWFKFNLPTQGTVNDYVSISFNHSLGDVDLELYNSSGEEIDDSAGVSNSERISLQNLASGDYYLKVFGYAGDTNPNYTLIINAPISNAADSFEPNNSRSDAKNLNSLLQQGQQQVITLGNNPEKLLSIHNNTDVDWFKFTTTDQGQDGDYAAIAFDHKLGDLDFQLYNSSGQLLETADGVANVHQISLKDRAAGTYYVKVFGYNGATNPNYLLTVDAPFSSVSGDWSESNNTVQNAKDLGTINRQYNRGNLSITDDDIDWFKFEIANQGTKENFVAINFNHQQGDLDIELYEADGITFIESSESVSNNENISLSGYDAGVYYLKVYGYDNAKNPNYELLINAPENTSGDWAETNDSKTSAYDLRNVEGLQYWDILSLHNGSDQDWFKFTTLGAADGQDYVRVDFDNTQGDVDLYLYNSTGNTLLGKSETAEGFEEIDLKNAQGSLLNAGTYLVQVKRYSQNDQPIDYQLSLHAFSDNEADWAESNDSKEEAENLQEVQGTKSWSGLSIHQGGDQDWFKFKTISTGLEGHSISIDFDHSQGDLQLQLYDSDRALIDSSTSNSNRELISLKGLSEGTYYIQVFANENTVTNPSYSLTIDAPQISKADWIDAGNRPNDTRTNAYDLRTVEGTLTLSGLSIHPSTDQDWFKFNLAEDAVTGQFVRVDFNHLEGDIQLELLNRNGVSLAQLNTDKNFEEISLDGKNAGTYYIKVSGVNDSTNPEYRLTVVGTPEAQPDELEPNDSPKDAYELRDIDQFINRSLSRTRNLGHAYYPYYNSYSYNPYSYNQYNYNNFGAIPSSSGYPAGGILSQYINQPYQQSVLGDLPLSSSQIQHLNNIELQQLNLGFQQAYQQAISTPPGSTFNLDIILYQKINDILMTPTMGWGGLSQFVASLPWTTQQAQNFINTPVPNNNIANLMIQEGLQNSFSYGLPNVSISSQIPLSLIWNSNNKADFDTGISISLSSLSLHHTNDQDWFSFKLTEDGKAGQFIAIDFDHDLGDLKLELFEGFDPDIYTRESQYQTYLVEVSDGTGDREQISLVGLAEGDYYIRVSGEENPNYSLSLSAPIGTDDIEPDFAEPNNSRNNAYDLRTVEGSRVLTGLTIDNETDQDWFKFSTKGEGKEGHIVRIDFSNEQGDLDLILYNQNGTEIARSETTENFEEISLDGLDQGTYQVKVFGYEGATNPNYSLSLFAPDTSIEPDRFEPNDDNDLSSLTTEDLNKATNLDQFEHLNTLSGLSIHTDDEDFFKFTTTTKASQNHSVSIEYESEEGELELTLYQLVDSNTVNEINSSSIGVDNKTVWLTDDGTSTGQGLAKGTYYIHVTGENETVANNYQLFVDVPNEVTETPEKDDWTIMVYMTASDLASFAFLDINEMEYAVSQLPGTVNFAVLWDQSQESYQFPTNGSINWDDGWGDVGRGIIQADTTNPSLLSEQAQFDLNQNHIVTSFERIGEQNTGDSQTLFNFVNWAKEAAPADNYALVMWDHGSGDLFGFNGDDEGNKNNPNKDSMFTNELVNALHNLKIADDFTFDLISFDACLMAMAEVGYALQDYTDIFVGSQENEGGDGYDYTTAFSTLGRNPDQITTEALATGIVSSYQQQYVGKGTLNDTHSASNSDGFSNLVTNLKSFTDAVIQNANHSDWNAIYDAYLATTGFSYEFYRDLGQFVQKIADNSVIKAVIRQAAQTVDVALNELIIAQTADRRNTNGLSVFLHEDINLTAPVVQEYLSSNQDFFNTTGWLDFINAFLANKPTNRSLITSDWAAGNNVSARAYNFNTLVGDNHNFTGLNLETVDDQDWYRFTITETATTGDNVAITYDKSDGQTLNFLLRYIDSNGQFIEKTATQTTTGQDISLVGLPQGEYRILVQGDGVIIPEYSLSINAPGTPINAKDWAKGNNLSIKAEDLGVMTGPTFFSGLQVDSLQADWFEFALPKINSNQITPVTVTVNLAGNQTITAQLFDDNNNAIAAQTGTEKLELTTPNPQPGQSYQLKISQSTPQLATAYSLEFASTVTNLPTLSINDITIREGNTGITDGIFTVTLSEQSDQVVTVDYNTANETAIAGIDYTTTSGTLTFNPGETSQTIIVPIVGDHISEINETFLVTLSNPIQGIIEDGQGQGIIEDDDTPVAPSNFSLTLDDTTYHPSESITLQGSAFDGNGFDNLAFVDLWLRNTSRIWTNIDQITTFNPDSQNPNQGNFIYQLDLDNYRLGNYKIMARVQDQQGAFTPWVKESFTLENHAPSNLSFTLNQDTYHPSQTLNLMGIVEDEDGNEDLANVEIKLRRGRGRFSQLTNLETIDSNGNFNYELDLDNYRPGTYQIMARVQDQQGAFSPWVKESFTIQNNAPSNLSFTLNQDTYHPSQTLNLMGIVEDEDGNEDLANVEIKLRRGRGRFSQLTNLETIDSNGNFNYELDLDNYRYGTYQIITRVQDKQGAFSPWVKESFTIQNQPPSNLTFRVNQYGYSPLDTLILMGNVEDEDGKDDLDTVDIRLKRGNGQWKKLTDLGSFDDDGGFNCEFDLDNYRTGNYQIKVRIQDEQGAFTPWVKERFTIDNIMPQYLTFALDQLVYDPSETLKLMGKVTDIDELENLDKVSFWLQDNNGVRFDIVDINSFDDNGNFNFQFDLEGYETGIYSMWGQAIDQQGDVIHSFDKLLFISPNYSPLPFEPIDELTGLSPLANYESIDFQPIDELTGLSPLANYEPIDPTNDINLVIEDNNMTNDFEILPDNTQLWTVPLGDYYLGTTSNNLPEEITFLSNNEQTNDVSIIPSSNFTEDHLMVI